MMEGFQVSRNAFSIKVSNATFHEIFLSLMLSEEVMQIVKVRCQ